jgi:hypothetical protein
MLLLSGLCLVQLTTTDVVEVAYASAVRSVFSSTNYY